MIASEQQYCITKREAQAFDEALSSLPGDNTIGDGDDALFRKLQVAATQSQRSELETDIADYEARLRDPSSLFR